MLALGGDLAPDTMLNAYSKGIFPWYNMGEPIQWFSPAPRFVLIPENLVVSKSMKQVLQKELFQFTIDKAFDEVIRNCKTVDRKQQSGTWITNELEKALITLHNMGKAHSVEVWQNGILCGGLYGISIGKVFFGESMFTKKSNASKAGFIKFVQWLEKHDFAIVDCQVYTPHLHSLGAGMISRNVFKEILDKACCLDEGIEKWEL